jgi:membrane protein
VRVGTAQQAAARPRHPRLDDFQRRHDWLGLPLAVIYKYNDDQGSYLAALITYYGFVSLFPLLLLAVSVLGFVLHGNPGLQHTILRSAVSNFPIIGKQLRTNVRGYGGSGAGLAVGVLGSVYGGLGVAQAGQNAMNIVWGVPRNRRPNPLKARGRSLLLLVLLGTGVVVTSGLSGLSTTIGGVGVGGRIGVTALSLLVNCGLFLVAFRVLTAHDVSTRDVAVGALASAVAWQVLQELATYYLAHKLRGTDEVYGLFGYVLGLLAWIYIEAVVVVLCAELNVVIRRRLWPRALLTPFTDDVDLTHADRDAYGSYARAQQFKGFERVDVDFDQPPPTGPAPTGPAPTGPAPTGPAPTGPAPPDPPAPGTVAPQPAETAGEPTEPGPGGRPG